MRYTTKMACKILGRDRKQQADDIATGHCGHVPEAVAGLRYWGDDDLAAELFFMDLRRDGHPVRLAGSTASRLRAAMRDYWQWHQLTLVKMQNGNRFAAPTATLDITSGWASGGPVRDAMIVDVRNLRERVRQLVESFEPVIGAEDEAA